MAFAVRIRYEEAGNSSVAGFRDWRQEQDEVLGGINDDQIRYLDSADRVGDAPSCHQVALRFDESSGGQALLDELSEDVFAGIKWYVVHSHQCSKDGSREECTDWTLERERGNVPEAYR